VSAEHSHGHAGHSHGVSADADARKLAVALGLTLGFMALEVAAGVVAHSLAPLSDSGHMLTDAAAIGLSLVAALMVRSGYGLVKASGRVFLEAAPEGLDPEKIGRALVREPGVVEVHVVSCSTGLREAPAAGVRRPANTFAGAER